MRETKKPQPQRCIGQWVEAVIFDLDGVITDTAKIHYRAWKQMFDTYLNTLAERQGDRPEALGPFERADYLRYVDGKPRYDGVRSFLQSRGIDMEAGSPDDPPERETICGLGNRKNQIFQKFIQEGQVEAYPAALKLLHKLKSRKIKTAVVSSSKNCKQVLAAAEILDLFDTRVDGVVSEELGLAGKPAPDTFLKAAEALKVRPKRAVVIEDAVSGVEAGRRGGFGCVIGVNRDVDLESRPEDDQETDRTRRNRELAEHGADRVVKDLSEIDFDISPRRRSTQGLRSALNRIDEIIRRDENKKILLFLDYDGTLTPIVNRPEDAELSSATRKAVRAAARRCTVAVVSGRGLDDVRRRVSLPNLYYAGSHGFEIEGPGLTPIQNDLGVDALPALEAAEKTLRTRLTDIAGTQVERKKFSISVHYRRTSPEDAAAVERIVDDVLKQQEGLRKESGKKVFELRPDVPWDKGRAVLWIMERLEHDPETVRPVYIGDDVTDEDAFRAIYGWGAGLVVSEGEDRPTYAGYGLADPAEVRLFLEKLAAALGPETT